MDNKERILAKTRELFLRYGIRSITMDEIASQLGISKKTIYQFFTDKDELVEAIVDDEVCQSQEECLDFARQAENAVHENFLAADHAEEVLRGMNPQVMYDLERHHPKAFRKFRALKYEFMLGMVRKNIERGIREGLYREDVQLELTARHRIESAFMPFNAEIFPNAKFPLNDTCFELGMLFLHSVTNEQGKELMETYLKERHKTIAHEKIS